MRLHAGFGVTGRQRKERETCYGRGEGDMATLDGKSDRELRLEDLNHRIDAELNRAEGWHDCDGLGFAQGYRDGLIAIELDIDTLRDGAVRCHVERSGQEFSGGSVFQSNINAPSLVSDDHELSVLVYVGNGDKGFRPLGSLVRLKRLNLPQVVGGQAFQIAFRATLEP